VVFPSLTFSFPLCVLCDLCGFLSLEDYVEVESELALGISEEDAEITVVYVAMHIQRVEMIGQVETAERKPEGVFRRDLKIFRDAGIERKEIREAFGIDFADVSLTGINHRERQSVAVFENRRNRRLPGQVEDAPAQKTIRQIGRPPRELVEADDREGEIADVGVELVHVAAGTAVDV